MAHETASAIDACGAHRHRLRPGNGAQEDLTLVGITTATDHPRNHHPGIAFGDTCGDACAWCWSKSSRLDISTAAQMVANPQRKSAASPRLVYRARSRTRIGPRALDGSTTRQPCVISARPPATSRRAARRAGSMRSLHPCGSINMATSEGQMLLPTPRSTSNFSIAAPMRASRSLPDADLHAEEQYFTCSQLRSHFFRQVISRPHAAHGLEGISPMPTGSPSRGLAMHGGADPEQISPRACPAARSVSTRLQPRPPRRTPPRSDAIHPGKPAAPPGSPPLSTRAIR